MLKFASLTMFDFTKDRVIKFVFAKWCEALRQPFSIKYLKFWGK